MIKRQTDPFQILPMCYAYTRSDKSLKMVKHVLEVYQEILSRQDGNYAAGGNAEFLHIKWPSPRREHYVKFSLLFFLENLTISDLSLIMGTVLLEVIEFDLTPYPKVKAWYENFKSAHADLWTLANQGLKELQEFEKNPPDLSQIQHPIHPTDRSALTQEGQPQEQPQAAAPTQ